MTNEGMYPFCDTGKPKVIEKLTITISNRQGVIGNKTWCLDGTRIPLNLIAGNLDIGGTKQLLKSYPHIKDLINKERGTK